MATMKANMNEQGKHRTDGNIQQQSLRTSVMNKATESEDEIEMYSLLRGIFGDGGVMSSGSWSSRAIISGSAGNNWWRENRWRNKGRRGGGCRG
jgi:hypothetical protein